MRNASEIVKAMDRQFYADERFSGKAAQKAPTPWDPEVSSILEDEISTRIRRNIHPAGAWQEESSHENDPTSDQRDERPLDAAAAIFCPASATAVMGSPASSVPARACRERKAHKLADTIVKEPVADNSL